MSEPLATPDDLGAVLNIASSINLGRAALLIQLATEACSTVINPVPADKRYVVLRVAARAYMYGSPPKGSQLAAAGGMAGDYEDASRGIYLTTADRADLERRSDAVPNAVYSVPLGMPYGPLL